jgi:hypothetical protein
VERTRRIGWSSWSGDGSRLAEARLGAGRQNNALLDEVELHPGIRVSGLGGWIKIGGEFSANIFTHVLFLELGL